MLFMDPDLDPHVALCWALNAKNALENHLGYSPFQIVFGEAPELPSVYAAGPPGLEEVNMSKKMAEQFGRLASTAC